MPFVLPEGLAPEVYPLAWLVGRWRGEGVLAYPGVEEMTFTQELVVSSDGGPYLTYASSMRLVVAPDDLTAREPAPAPEAAAAPDAPPSTPAEHSGPVWSSEVGYWRVPPEPSVELAEGQHPVEQLVADPSGHVAIYVGNGQMIDAPHAGSSVGIHPVWSGGPSTIRRVLPTDDATSAVPGTSSAPASTSDLSAQARIASLLSQLMASQSTAPSTTTSLGASL